MNKDLLKKIGIGVIAAGVFMLIYNKSGAVRKLVGGQ